MRGLAGAGRHRNGPPWEVYTWIDPAADPDPPGRRQRRGGPSSCRPFGDRPLLRKPGAWQGLTWPQQGSRQAQAWLRSTGSPLTSLRLASGRVTPRRLRPSSAALARIEAINPSLTAVVSVDPATAMAAATRADSLQAGGAAIGPLHGVPITLKDGHDVAGLRTTVGTDAYDRVADRDGAVAARLRAAGAILIGHTNVPPFLADYQSENALFGRTRNPWDTGRTPGGSSGGAASAIAAGLTPLEVGSDMTGSLRLPASFCGIYGLKPTEHRVPLTGFFRPPPGTPRSVRILLALGPMARDLADIELALTILAGPDGHDFDVAPVPETSRETAIALEGLRVAAVEEIPGATVGTAMRSTLRGVADRLTGAGSVVTEKLPRIDWDEADALFLRLLGAVSAIVDPGNDA